MITLSWFWLSFIIFCAVMFGSFFGVFFLCLLFNSDPNDGDIKIDPYEPDTKERKSHGTHSPAGK